ncbi:MAG: hypothetical protein ACRENE_25535, partial [Polyangiaceae bacterium]
VCVSYVVCLGVGVSCAPQPAPVTAPSGAPASTASTENAAAPGSSSPASPAPAAPAASSAPSTPDAVVAANRAGLDACYTKARAGDPKLGHTKVDMSYVIDADGTPKTVDFKYRHRMDDSAKNCMRDAALAVHFPASMVGPQTATIVFSPPTP